VEPKAVGLLRKFESIKTQVEDILNNLKTLEKMRIQTRESYSLSATSEIYDLEKEKTKETQMVLDEYWKLSSEVYNILKVGLSYFSPPKTVEEAKGTLRLLSTECDRIIGNLSSLISPLPPEERDILNKFWLEILEVIKKLDINYEKNLSLAKEEHEKGHFLASVLITSRVVICALDKIEGKTEQEKIKFLRDKGIIQKDRKDVEEFIIKASKKARNFFSHNINIFANSADSLGMLGDSAKLLKILSELKDVSEDVK
jgi:hypothetical protein